MLGLGLMKKGWLVVIVVVGFCEVQCLYRGGIQCWLVVVLDGLLNEF